MKIAMTGVGGFVGSNLTQALKQDDHTIIPLGRTELSGSAESVVSLIQGVDAIINLAGETINRRWSKAYKKRMVSSRVDTTTLLVDAMALLEKKPAVFISTSAIGAYSTEGSYSDLDPPNATDFLGNLSRDWEAAANRAKELGIRTIIFRFGLVLGRSGGIIKQLLPIFKLGLGGPVGNGKQAFSWIHIDDLIKANRFALSNQQMQGAYSLCAPNPDTNLGFTRKLAKALHRPAFFPVPLFMLKLVYGEGADVMTSGQTLVSERLPQEGFEFDHAELDEALVDLVNR